MLIFEDETLQAGSRRINGTLPDGIASIPDSQMTSRLPDFRNTEAINDGAIEHDEAKDDAGKAARRVLKSNHHST